MTSSQTEAGPATGKGRATRERIVAAAASLMYEHGVSGTSTPAIREAAQVSSSQIYHYFADKDALTRAVITFQAETIMAGQRPLLARLDSVAALRAWRDLVVDAAARRGGRGGCPLGSLSGELADELPWAREALEQAFRAWSAAIRDGLTAMVDGGRLRADTDTERLALALLAAMQGGLLLAQALCDTEALAAGLDVVIDQVEACAV